MHSKCMQWQLQVHPETASYICHFKNKWNEQCTLVILQVEIISSLQPKLHCLSVIIPRVAVNLPVLKRRPTATTSLAVWISIGWYRFAAQKSGKTMLLTTAMLNWKLQYCRVPLTHRPFGRRTSICNYKSLVSVLDKHEAIQMNGKSTCKLSTMVSSSSEDLTKLADVSTLVCRSYSTSMPEHANHLVFPTHNIFPVIISAMTEVETKWSNHSIITFEWSKWDNILRQICSKFSTEFIQEISTRTIQFAEFLIKRMDQVHASWLKKYRES